MDAPSAVEQHNTKETALQRLTRHSGELVIALGRIVVLVVMLTPILLISFLTVDIPMRAFDVFFGDGLAARASNWLTRGGMLMAFVPMIAILITRRYGAEEASRAITAAWGVAAVIVFAELSYLAPALEDGDMPGVRFTVVFVASAMASQYLAVNFYDVARGGGHWWRAPLYGALLGALSYGLIYFPGMYIGKSVPWVNWFVGDFAIKALLAFAFLPVYGLMRDSLRPVGGFGGR